MNAPNKSGWKPSAPLAGDTESATFTGNRALMLEEPLIFEIGHIETTGVDLPEPQADAPSRLGGLERTDTIGLPGLSEPECVRHYTRLSRQNYAIDLGLFPLGSCTMKHNPRLNEKVARMPGFADVHPLQPQETVQGAYAVIHELAEWLITLTGMHSVAMSPKAGAHGELCGLMAIRAAHEDVLAGGMPRDGGDAALERLGRDRGDVVNETRISKNRELRGHVAPDGDDVFPPNIEGGAEHPVGVGALIKNLFAGLGVDGAHGVVAATKGDGRAIG